MKSKRFLAIFWNRPLPVEASLHEKRNQVYQRYAPELAAETPSYEQGNQHWIKYLDQSGYFEPPEVKRHLWKASYTTQQYLGLLHTYSDHLRLSEEKQQELFAGVEEVLEGEGGTMEKPYEAVAFIALKRSAQNNAS